MDFQFIISCLYFFLPAYFTNMTPPLAKKANVFNFLDKPIDSNKKLNNEPVLGTHKTYRGATLGIAVGILVVYIQKCLYQLAWIQEISFFDYEKINILLLGILLCSGAVFGDLLFAFIKRRLKLKPGTKFLPFDQINYVIGVYIFFSLTSFFKGEESFALFFTSAKTSVIDNSAWTTLLISSFFLHIIVNHIGYYLRIHKAKW